ncbi:hypothetical protein HanRHA438_Chr05g0206001 [Helianthus annuus]|uniref:Uncharacterized protein n=1 Tax=Helianthus annuus TaxID=4232 RepID=A0A251UMB8_HELAN|nr:hypothetical protein HanXRQr2_Chr05g0196491 [Helianthus annuus]KAJ0746044.1 hypothetical protein HanOQP8_Chr05g0173021 [Helianthus annuus]KAJ0917441.1 hypothetical protein HanRHA438_Chr05g0206001 [Helianthus annuus]
MRNLNCDPNCKCSNCTFSYSNSDWYLSNPESVMRCERGCSFEVEVQVCKIHCVSKAPPGLTINVEDAATSEAEIYKALEVCY